MSIKELQGDDYDKLGLSRSVFSAMSGDDEKMAKSLQLDSDKKGLGYSVKRNKRTGEWGLFNKDGNIEGVINKKGFSKQDVANELRSPLNYVPLPFLQVGKLAVPLVKKLVQGAKMGGTAGVVDFYTNTIADVQNKDGLDNLDKNISRAGTTAVATPLIAGVGSKLAKVVTPNKKVPLKQDDIPLTRGQSTGNIKDLELENKALKGELGSKSQQIIEDFRAKQLDSVKSKLNRDLGVSFDDPNKNIKLGDEVQEVLRNTKANELEKSNKLYQDVSLDKASLNKKDTQELLGNLEKSIGKEGLESVKTFGSYAPQFEAKQVVDNLKNGLARDDYISLSKLELGRKMINEAISKASRDQDKTTLATLMNVKSAYDKSLNEFKNKFIGDKSQVQKLVEARKNKADYHYRFTNTNEAGLKSQGAEELIDIVNNPNKTGVDITKLLDPTRTSTTKQLQALNKLRQVGNNDVLQRAKIIYLNSLLSDISEKGGSGALRNKRLAEVLSDNLDKNPAVANKILDGIEKEKLSESRELINKINSSDGVIRKSNLANEIKKGVGEGVLSKVPFVGDVYKGTKESIVYPMILRRYLEKNYIKKPRITNETADRIGARASLILGNEINR